jgi:hypothetical protein
LNRIESKHFVNHHFNQSKFYVMLKILAHHVRG